MYVIRKIYSSVVSRPNFRFFRTQKSRNDIRIVVIGAGLAGLSAASHLITNGFKNTVILEASDRYGGRVNSKNFGDTFCELGAKYITIDTTKDSTYELICKSIGLPKAIDSNRRKSYINIKGEKVDKKLLELVNILFTKICVDIEFGKNFNTERVYDLNNVHTYFKAETYKIIKSIFRNTEQNLVNDIFSALMKEFSGLIGCCLEYVNVEYVLKMQWKYNNQIYLPTGMDNILSHICNSFDMNKHVKFGKPVKLITWNNFPQKNVGCLDGTVFFADHIVCTMPLGVLKNFSYYMFNPFLSEEKLNSIKQIGFGSPLKIYFEYEKDVKQWFSTNFCPISSFEDHSDINWTQQVIEIKKVPTSCRVIEINVGGGFYEKIEKLSDESIVHGVSDILRKCLQKKRIPHPISLLRSNWSSNACFLGGQPYFSINTTIADINILSAPIGEIPILLFAGDATILKGFGTVDGARKSGIREAQRIIQLYNSQY